MLDKMLFFMKNITRIDLCFRNISPIFRKFVSIRYYVMGPFKNMRYLWIILWCVLAIPLMAQRIRVEDFGQYKKPFLRKAPYTTDKRLEELVRQKAEPRNRSEQEISGYREVLATIHESYEYINPRPNIILQLHRDLYSYSGGNAGGNYKNSDNVIAETDVEGHQKARFIPVPAFQTPEAMNELCTNFLEAWEADRIDKLILIPMFILDFLCIHPFNDGNGRMSRLLTLLLLYRAGYIVGMYISIEKLIEQTKETYYETLQESSANWHEEKNEDLPFVRYMLGVIIAAYRDFSSRVQLLTTSGLTKPERVREIVRHSLGKITRAQIMEKCPDISRVTVERALTSMVKKGEVLKIGGGRYTAYVWNRENE